MTSTTSFWDRFDATVRQSGITRPREGRVVLGVLVGVSRRYGIDPVLTRVGFVITGLVLTLGLSANFIAPLFPMYLLAALVLPGPDGQIELIKALKQRDPQACASLFAVVLMLVLSSSRNSSWLGDIASLVFIAALLWMLVKASSKKSGSHKDPSAEGATATTPVPPMPPVPTQNPAATGLVFDPVTQRWSQGMPPASGPWTPPVPQSPLPVQPVVPAAPPVTPLARATSGDHRRRQLIAIMTWAFAAVLASLTYLLLEGAVPQATRIASAGAAALAGTGLVLLIMGLRGTRNRSAAWISTGLAIALVISANAPNPAATSFTVGDQTIRPTSVADLTASYSAGIGEIVLDLTAIPATQLQALDAHGLDVQVGLGALTVIIPDAISAQVNTSVGVGSVRVDRSDGESEELQDGLGSHKTTQFGSGSSDLLIDANVGVGDLIIESRKP